MYKKIHYQTTGTFLIEHPVERGSWSNYVLCNCFSFFARRKTFAISENSIRDASLTKFAGGEYRESD